jgi:shikimate dehydrogenase
MLEGYSGKSRVYFILGHPIGQVKAPSGMTKFFEEQNRDAICVPIDVEARHFDSFVTAVSTLRNVDGLSITVPHKFVAFRQCATVSERARLLTSCNVLRRNVDGTWHGDMLDGLSCVAAMQDHGCIVETQRALLVGAGGAGSAIGLALLDAGAAQLAVHDSDPTRRDELISRLRQRHAAKVVAGSADPSGFGIVANATPAGMKPDDPLPVAIEGLSPNCFVSDVITLPAITPLLAAAGARGCRTSTGVEMFHAARKPMFDFWFNGA